MPYLPSRHGSSFNLHRSGINQGGEYRLETLAALELFPHATKEKSRPGPAGGSNLSVNEVFGALRPNYAKIACRGFNRANELLTCDPWSRTTLARGDVDVAEPQRGNADAYHHDPHYYNPVSPSPVAHDTPCPL